jgi:hypothetical protein
MMRKAENEQKKFDAVKDNWGVIQSSMDDEVMKVDRNPLLSGIIGESQRRINEALQNYDGDWRKLDNLTRNIATEYSKAKRTGYLAAANDANARREANLTEIDESDMEGIWKERTSEQGEGMYTIRGGALGGARYEAIHPYAKQDYSFLPEVINKIHESGGTDANVTIDKKRNLLINYGTKKRGVSERKIQGIVRDSMMTNAAFQDMADVQYRWYKYDYAKRGESFDDFLKSLKIVVGDQALEGEEAFKEFLFQRKIGNDAFKDYAWSTVDDNLTGSQTHAAKVKAEQIAETAQINFVEAHHFGENNGEWEAIANSGSWQGMFGGSATTLTLEQNEGEYKKFMDDLQKDLLNGSDLELDAKGFMANTVENYNALHPGVDLNIEDPAAQYVIMNELQTNSELATLNKNSGFANTPSAVKRVQDMARNHMNKIRRRTETMVNAAAQLVGSGKITKAEYDTYAQTYNQIWTELDETNSLLNNLSQGGDPNLVTAEKARLRKKAADLVNNTSLWMSPMSGSWRSVTPVTTAGAYESADNNLHALITKINKALDETDILPKQYKSANTRAVKIGVSSGEVPVFGDDGQMDHERGQELYAEFSNMFKSGGLQKSILDLGKTTVLKGGKRERVSLREAIGIQAKAEVQSLHGDNYDQEILDKKEGELIKKAFESGGWMIPDSFDPATNSMMIKFGQNYVDLAPGAGNIEIKGMLDRVPMETKLNWRVNGTINKAVMSPSDRYYYGDEGIYIRTWKPGQHTNLDKFVSRLPGGDGFAVQVSLKAMGIKKDPAYQDNWGRYQYIVGDSAHDFLKQLEKFKTLAANPPLNTTPPGKIAIPVEEVDKKTGKKVIKTQYITLQQAKEELVRKYTMSKKIMTADDMF